MSLSLVCTVFFWKQCNTDTDGESAQGIERVAKKFDRLGHSA